ncbi:hypothetical protein [Agrococcus sp. GCM10030264]
MRRRILAAPIALAVVLAGCAVEQGASPSPSAVTSPTPSVAPTSSATPTPTPTPTPIPTPFAEPVAEPPQCGDAYVVESSRGGAHGMSGTDAEVLAALMPRPAFLAADALDGLDTFCTVTTTTLVDGPPNPDGTPRILDVSIAFVGGGAATDESLAAWAAANGYAADGGGDYPEHVAPAAADGTTTRKIVWMPASYLGWDEAEALAQSTLLGVDVAIDDRVVVFYDFTIPQG